MMSTGKKILMYSFLSVASFLSLFPIYWMIISATNRSVDIVRGTLTPGSHLFQNLSALLSQQNVVLALANSFRNAIALTVISVLICSLAGYGFEVYYSKAKDRLMNVLLLAMMIPFAAVMIPLWRMFANMGLLNSTVGFILPTLSTPLLIMLFRQSARSFPHELIDAARIDGVSELGIFFRMFIPTMKSTYAAAITITFMAAWNSFLWPRIIMMSNEFFTMPMLISNLIAGYVTDNGVVMLAVLIATIPTAVLFLILQRNFAQGITGAIK